MTSYHRHVDSTRPAGSIPEDVVTGKILVVEDEPEILEPLAHSLQKAGFHVLRAEDGLSACRLIGSEQPDLILLDIMLPDLDGWEVCRLLRQHPDPVTASTPVIMLTALAAPENKYLGLEIGADLFLPKPYSIREVMLHARNLVKRRQKTIKLETHLKALTSKSYQSPDFHHMLFHELRNQLFILNGFTELLYKNPEKRYDETCMGAIYRSSHHLQNLAEEVMLIRQVEEGQMAMEFEHFTIDSLIADIMELYRAPAREKRVKLLYLVTERQPVVYLNLFSVKIILSSLLDNALKYGPEGQSISLCCQQKEMSIELSVTDQGPGIPEELQEQVFEAYYRPGDQAGKTQGSGLGLYSVKTLARAMGGDVMLESHNGHGSCFRVRLPMVATQ